MDLNPLIKKVVRAGGSKISSARRKTLFGNDWRKAKNLVEASQNLRLKLAIKRGLITDHRVISELRRAGPVASDIIVRIETKHSEALPRSRAHSIVDGFLRFRREAEALERTKRFLAAMMEASRQHLRVEEVAYA